MNELMAILGWTGIYAPTALGAIGSIIGCTLAGQAAVGAMLDTETGHARLVGISAMPSSQVIYGIVVMLTLQRPVSTETGPGLFAIGVLVGVALLYSGMRQGHCCASAVTTAKEKPEVFGLALAPAAIVEGFAVFAFVFALVISANLPTG